MSITDIFIKRPVLAICVNLLIFLAGYQALTSLTVRQYPQSDSSVAVITTAYVGADADLVRGFVTTPIERVIASIEGIDYLESESKQGLSTIRVQLTLNYDTNAALAQIQSKIAQVRNDLPPEAEAPTINIESSDNRFAAVYISFFAKDLERNQITDYLMRVVQPKLSSISGVQKADILGARTFAMRIWLKPERMAAFNITASEVRAALSANNYLSALGSSKGSMIKVDLLANTDLQSTEEFKRLVVKKSGESLIRLEDIADVVLGAESYEEDVRFGGETATFMGIWALPTANSIDVVKVVRSAITDLEKNLPYGMQVKIPYDSTKYINDALNQVVKTLTETVLIVIIVIYLFIGSIRSVLVPVVAIPLSLVGAGILMYLFGFTVNLLTLLGIVLAVGIVVDDAIVMLENIERHVKNGMSPYDAAIKGARELVGPTIAMTITLAAVYTPIGLQGGLTGTLFREFAFTLAGAVLMSGVVAITLSPMMSSKLIKVNHNPSKLAKYMANAFDRLQNWYQRALTAVISEKKLVIILALFLILLAPLLAMFSAKELAPREDQGIVFGIVQASPNNTIEQTSRFTTLVNRIYQSVPETENTFQVTSPMGGFSGAVLKPWSERSRTAAEIQGQLFGELAGKVPGIRTIVTTPAPLPGGSNFPVEIVISTTNEPREIVEFANQLVAKAFQSGLFMFADTDLKYDLPKAELILDRDKLASLGLTQAQVGADLSTMLGGNYVNRFNIQGRAYKVIPLTKRVDRLNPEQLKDLYVTGPDGKVIPVSAFATIKEEVQPRQLNKFQQLNSAKIQGVPRPGASLNQALSFLEDEAAKILPKGYQIDYAGESRQLRKEGNDLVTSLILALVVIFLVLAAQFESFRDPFIILAGSVPLALAGALIFTFYNFTSLNIYSQVGLITLVGLVAKNGILIVEFANLLREEGLDKVSAIVQASSTRLRAILMTSVATVVGHFPLVIATGAGSGSRNSIGIVLVSGMTIGTIFTLFVVPCIYLVIASERKNHEK